MLDIVLNKSLPCPCKTNFQRLTLTGVIGRGSTFFCVTSTTISWDIFNDNVIMLSIFTEKLFAMFTKIKEYHLQIEAPVCIRSSKYVFLKISQYSQKKNCVGVSLLIKLQA